MISKKFLFGGAAMAALAGTVAEAQVTTSSIRGVVQTDAGAPVSGATITIVHNPTGSVETVTTGADGSYGARGLRVGGPYTLTVNASGFEAATAENVFLRVNETFPGDVTLSSARTLDAVIVTGTASSAFEAQTGPRSTFNLDTIESLPSVSRDIRDIARLDPLVSVDPTNNGAITIGGNNNRFNSLTIDGIKFNDLFGLNANGFPSQRSPISIDALETLSVEQAPYDVEFSGFTGGTINILTKSGENEFFGSAYYFQTDDSLAGNRLGDFENGNRTVNRDFEETTFGATLGGPIIKDKLFFFVAYEELEEAASLQDGPAGSGAINEESISLAEYNEIRDIVQRVYDFDAGDFASAGGQPVTDEKLLVTLDWNITDDHRAKFTYIDNEGSEIQERNNGSDLGSPSTWYNRSEESTAYAVQVFSDWTPNFSTELKLAYSEQITGQDSLNGADFANFEVTTSDGSTLSIGPDFFRHANELENELFQFKLVGTYLLGNHTLKFGFERDEQDVFNLFVPGSEGSYEFDSVADLEARTASSLFYQNAITNNEVDGAASFDFAVNSFYIQDEWQVNDKLTLAGGLRYEYYEAADNIAFNQNFFDRYGFTNTTTVDGLDVILPRASFVYDYSDAVTFRGGIGAFSGGTPSVWISNNYSNSGVTIDTAFRPGPLTNVDGRNIPQDVQDSLTAGDGNVNVLDPNFEIPVLYRANLGLDLVVDIYGSKDWEFGFDVIYGETQDATFWKDQSCADAPIGTAPDGRPIYNCGIDGAFLSNLSTQQVIDFYDDNGIAATAATAGFDTDGDGTVELGEVEVAPEALLLTNVDEGEQLVLTAKFRKEWDNGFTLGGSYTYQDVTDAHSGTSSTASSNYSDYASFDRQNPNSAVSNYQIEHEFKLFVDWEKEFVDGFPFRATLFGTRRSGQPFSFTYDYSGGRERSLYGIREGRADDEGELFYVPTGMTDPNFNAAASFGGDADTLNDFFAFLDQSGLSSYAGGIAPRNEFESRWYTAFDLRLQQQLPGLRSQDRTVIYVDIENVGNLLNEDWGRLEQVRYEYNQPVANVDIVDGQYVYSGFPERSAKSITENASLWQVQLGVKYVF